MAHRKPNWLLVVAAFGVRDGKIMLGQRPAGKHLAGLWEFPGGKIEVGESPEAALAREVREELAVECRVGMLLDAVSYSYPDFDLMMLLYHVEVEGEPQAREVAQVKWLSVEEIEQLPVPPADLPLVGKVRNYLFRIQNAL